MKKILILLILTVFLTGCVNLASKNITKRGVLTNVSVTGFKVSMTFADNTTVTIIENDQEDTDDIYQYLNGLKDQEIIIEYAYDFGEGGFELNSVIPLGEPQ